MLSNKNKQSIEKLQHSTIATLTTNEGDSIDVTYFQFQHPTEYLTCIPYTSNQRIEIAVPPEKDGLEKAFEQMIELYSQYIKYHPEERAAAAHHMEGFDPETQPDLAGKLADYLPTQARFTEQLSHYNYDFELQWMRKSLNPAHKGENILVARLADGFEAHVAIPELTKGNIAQAYTYLETQCAQHAFRHQWDVTLAQKNLRAQQRQIDDENMALRDDKTFSSEQRLNMQKMSEMICGNYVHKFTATDGVEFMGIYYQNGADIGLPEGPTVIAAFHAENGMVYKSMPLASENYRECLDVLESMMNNLEPNIIQQHETADIIRADINNAAAARILQSMDRHRNRTTHFTMMTEEGYIVEAKYRKDGAHIGIPGRDVLHCVNPDGQTMSMNISGARMNDIMKDVNTFAASYDKYLAPTRDDVAEELKPLTVRDDSEIDDIDTGDIGNGDL